MLVLSRKEGERVVLTGDITITVMDLRSTTVKLGFDAPQGVEIVRAEIADREDLEVPTDEVV